MKKQGFTLIELMVVVVIIGILAAVAVPKLFGMIAKSKASEVGPAAGEYVKLQEAYYAETAHPGDWAKIGFKLSGTAGNGDEVTTTNFKYVSGAVADNATTAALTATSTLNLNDCLKGSAWGVDVAEVSGALQAEASITPANGGQQSDCEALTPNFKALSYNGALKASSTGGNPTGGN